MKQAEWCLVLVLFFAVTAGLGMLFACGGDDDDDNDAGDDDTGDDDSSDDDTADDDTGDDDSGDDDSDDDDDDTNEDVWTDSSSGLMWQVEGECCFTWQQAADHCGGLDHGDYDDWRLPTDSQLRSLIRGCTATETNGVCGVTDDCLQGTCWSELCGGCEFNQGPGPDGLYRPDGLTGDGWYYWSSSGVAGDAYNAWYVNFDNAYVGDNYVNDEVNVRCVRP